MSNEIILMAIDDGSGNIATRHIDANGYACEAINRSVVVDRVLANGLEGISSHAWNTNDKQFTVTDNHSDAINTCNRDYQVSDANRVLVHDAISSTINDDPVYIAVTLPTEQFYAKGADSIINSKRIEEKRQNVLTQCDNHTAAMRNANILGVKVFPESIPAYVYCSLDENLEPKSDYPTDHKTLIIDLGRYTCDICIVGTNYTVIDYKTTDHGVQQLVNKFKVLLQKNSERLAINDLASFSDKELDDLINRKYLGSTFEHAASTRRDITDIVNESKEYLAELVLNDALALCKNDFNMLTRIVLVGGGANWLNELSQQWFHTVDIPFEPELAIVRGTHIMLENMRDTISQELLAMNVNDESSLELTENN